MAKLSREDLDDLRRSLLARQSELRRGITEAMGDPGRENLSEIVGRVRDPGEESVADFVATLNLTLLEREVKELRDIEEALKRMHDVTYGRCAECGREIERARLLAYPTASLCMEDARRLERRRSGGQDLTPSL